MEEHHSIVLQEKLTFKKRLQILGKRYFVMTASSVEL